MLQTSTLAERWILLMDKLLQATEQVFDVSSNHQIDGEKRFDCGTTRWRVNY